MTDLEPLWTSEAAVKLIGGRSTKDWSATGVSIDSRTIEPGDLFFSFSGGKLDGHHPMDSAF